MAIEHFAYFTAYKLQRDVNDCRPSKGDPAIVLRHLWDWCDRFSGRTPDRAAMRDLDYDPSFEASADEWLEEVAFSADPDDEPFLEPLAGRIVYERAMQAMTVIVANQLQGETLMLPLVELGERDKQMAMALLWLHNMTLPFEVGTVGDLPARP